MTDDEKNRVIAEWLEPEPYWQDDWECNSPAQYSGTADRPGLWERTPNLEVVPSALHRWVNAQALLAALTKPKSEGGRGLRVGTSSQPDGVHAWVTGFVDIAGCKSWETLGQGDNDADLPRALRDAAYEAALKLRKEDA